MSWTEVPNMLDTQAVGSQGRRALGTFMPDTLRIGALKYTVLKRWGVVLIDSGEPKTRDSLMGLGVQNVVPSE